MKRLRTVGMGIAVAGAALLALAAPAGAPVTVSAPGATRSGSDQEITFRVPVEKKTDTVALAIALPTSTPIASVLVKPIPGWTHTEKTATLPKPIVTDDGTITQAVSEIDWKAEPGHGLAPGEYGDFTILAGQLPDSASVVFGAIQTYSDGSTVAWNQTAAPGSTEPQFPAPTLTLAAASAGANQPAAAPPASAPKAASDTGAIVLSIIALVLAAGALGLGVVTRAQGSRSR